MNETLVYDSLSRLIALVRSMPFHRSRRTGKSTPASAPSFRRHAASGDAAPSVAATARRYPEASSFNRAYEYEADPRFPADGRGRERSPAA